MVPSTSPGACYLLPDFRQVLCLRFVICKMGVKVLPVPGLLRTGTEYSLSPVHSVPV